MKNVLIDIGHPAHVHLFKNFIWYLKDNKYNVIVVSRSKDLTVRLLDSLQIDHICISSVQRGIIPMFGEMLQRDLAVLKLHRKYRFDFAFGTSLSIAHLSALSSVKSFILEEDDDDIIPLFAHAAYPFVTGIIIPHGLRFQKWKKKRIFHNSYHELAYLHPDVFKPEKSVLKKYKLEPHSYIILRHSAFQAHHDRTEAGLSTGIWEEVKDIVRSYPVLISQEKGKMGNFDPVDVHHLISFSKLVISDSQTMTVEASVLGTPSIRYNSFVGRLSVLNELERDYQLTFGFRPKEESLMLKKIRELLSYKDLESRWRIKQDSLLKEKINFSDWLIQFMEQLP